MRPSTEGTKAPEVRELTSTFAHIAAVVAGLAIFVTGFTVSRNGPLRGIVTAVAFGVVAALLITAVRGLG
jgi:hypothetical protein